MPPLCPVYSSNTKIPLERSPAPRRNSQFRFRGLIVLVRMRGWHIGRGVTTWSFQVSLLVAASALLLPAQEVSFSARIYPILEQAGCRNCHNLEGVASPTRL